MSSPTLSLRTLTALILAGCSGSDAAKVDTGPECPHDISSFCAFEFGDSCPLWSDVITMGCDGAHFVPPGEGTTPGYGDGDGGGDCPYPVAGCTDTNDPNHRTNIFWDRDGLTILWVDAWWQGDYGCGLDYAQFGTPLC